MRALGPLLLAMLAIEMCGVSSILCDTLSTWKGGTGNWGTAGNWTPAIVPNNSGATSYAVTIGSGGADIVDVDLKPTIGFLTLGAASGSAELDYSPAVPSIPGLTVQNGVTINSKGTVQFSQSGILAGSLTNAGAMTFFQGGTATSGNLTNSGSINLSQSTLSANGTVTNSGGVNLNYGSVFAGNLINSGSMSLFANDQALAVDQTLVNNGAIQLATLGGGTASITKLVNNSSFETDGTIVTAGKWLNSGTVSIPAGAGLLGGVNVGTGTPASGYNQFADGTLQEVVFGSSHYGTIAVDGPALLSGTLDIALQNGFIPASGESFAILTFTPGELTGAFSSILGDPYFAVSYNNSAGNVTLTAEPTPEPTAIFLVGPGVLVICGRRQWARLLATAPYKASWMSVARKILSSACKGSLLAR